MLHKTLNYLIESVLPRTDVPFAEVYNFIRDRTRAIRQDLTIQVTYLRLCFSKGLGDRPSGGYRPDRSGHYRKDRSLPYRRACHFRACVCVRVYACLIGWILCRNIYSARRGPRTSTGS